MASKRWPRRSAPTQPCKCTFILFWRSNVNKRPVSIVISLRLEQNWAGVDGCQAIADALKNFAKLTHLNLARNEIGDDSARMLGNALKHNRTLVKLELQGERHLDKYHKRPILLSPICSYFSPSAQTQTT